MEAPEWDCIDRLVSGVPRPVTEGYSNRIDVDLPDATGPLAEQQRALFMGLPHLALLVGADLRTLGSNRRSGPSSGGFFWEDLGISDGAVVQRMIHLSNECLQTGGNCFCQGVEFSDGVCDLHWIPAGSGAFFLYVQDVTAQQYTAEALTRTAGHARLITEVVLQGIFQFDSSGRVVYVNPAAIQMVGCSEEEARQMTFAVLFAGGEVLLEEKIGELMAGRPVVVEDTLICKSGNCVPVFLSNAPLLDDDARYQGFICSMVDISQRKKNQEELTFLSAAVNQTDEAIAITEESGRIIFVNPAFEELSGYSRTEVIGKTPKILHSGKQDKAFYATMWRTILAGRTWAGRVVNRRKDGALYTESCIISPFRDSYSNRTYFMSFRRDIGDHVKEEQQQRQMQKMTALGRLAGGVAHDFNNVLQGILGLSDMALLGDGSAEEMEQYIREIRDEVQRGKQLPSQLLAFSRNDQLPFSAVNLYQLVTDQRDMLKRLIGEHIQMELTADPDLPAVSAVSSQIEQVLMNLCVNARDAMAEGGTLSLSLSEVRFEEGGLSAGPGTQAGRYVCLTVSDTGVGMDEKVLDRLFEPFFTTKGQGQGTGLGLSIVFGIIKQHQGWVDVSSEEGRGTVFNVFLPVAETPRQVAVAEDPLANQSVQVDGRGETALVIEDEPSIRQLLVRLLEQHGFKVSCAADSIEARAFFEREQGRIALLVSDIVLPGQNGFGLAREFVEKDPNLPVVLCSGFCDQVVSVEEIHAAGFRFVSKPFSLKDMLVVVAEAIREKRSGADV